MSSISLTVFSVPESGVPVGFLTFIVNSPWLSSGISSLPRFINRPHEPPSIENAIKKIKVKYKVFSMVKVHDLQQHIDTLFVRPYFSFVRYLLMTASESA